MSEIKFSGYRTPYDEDQAYQRYMSILKTKSKLSKDMQQSSLNDSLNVPPLMPVPKTASEILNDEAQVNKMVQQYIIDWFPDSPNLVKSPNETDAQYDMRKYPAKYIFNNLSQNVKKLLVEQYPAIKTDLQQVGALTPQYFINFLLNYTTALQKSGGVNRFSNFKDIDEIKGLIKNLPNKSDIQNVLNLIEEVRNATPKNVDDKLDEIFYSLNAKILQMLRTMPTNNDINDLQMAIRENGFTQEIQQVLDTLETLPTTQQLGAIGTALLEAIENNNVEELKETIQEILVQISDNQIETQDMKESLTNIKRNVDLTKNNIVELNQKANIRLKEGVIKELYDTIIQNRLDEFNEEIEFENALIIKENEAIAKRNKNVLRRNNYAIATRLAEIEFARQDNAALPPEQRYQIQKPLSKKDLEPYEKPIQLRTLLQSTSNLPKDVVRQAQEEAQILAMQEAQKQKVDDTLSPFQQEMIPATYQPSEYQQQPMGQEQQQIDETTNEQKGNGMANRVKNKIQPKFITRQKMIGKGVSVDGPKYIEFGKFCISIADLNNDVLRVKYQTTMVDVPNFKNKISSDFVDFLNNFIETQKISERQLEKLSKEEQKIFRNLINKSGLNVKYKVKDYKTDDETEEENRFNLVKGQYMAGNDNPRVKDELRKFIIKFMMENKINKKEGQEILFQLSM